MTLISDLLHALLIPLVGWDVQLGGLSLTVPVSPLLLIVAFVAGNHLLHRLVRRVAAARRHDQQAADGWEERPGGMTVADS